MSSSTDWQAHFIQIRPIIKGKCVKIPLFMNKKMLLIFLWYINIFHTYVLYYSVVLSV